MQFHINSISLTNLPLANILEVSAFKISLASPTTYNILESFLGKRKLLLLMLKDI